MTQELSPVTRVRYNFQIRISIFAFMNKILDTCLYVLLAISTFLLSCKKTTPQLSLDLKNITTNGTLWKGLEAKTVSINIPYSNGNNMQIESKVFASSGVTGLNAILNAGTLGINSGTLSLSVLGSPSTTGTAIFPITVNGQSCVVTMEVLAPEAGTKYQGGTITLVLTKGYPKYIEGEVHGLIISDSDVDTSAEWGCLGTAINGADGVDFGTGLQNTIDILKDCKAPNTSAALCDKLAVAGYDDWYLPSRAELISAIQFLGEGWYWSSTEYLKATLPGTPENNAFAVSKGAMGSYFIASRSKDIKCKVRAIRSF